MGYCSVIYSYLCHCIYKSLKTFKMKKIFVSIALMASLFSVCAVELNLDRNLVTVNMQANGSSVKLTKISNPKIHQYAKLVQEGDETYVVLGGGRKGLVVNGSRFGYDYAANIGGEWWGFNS